MKTVATLPTAKAIPNTSRFLAFLTLLDCRSTCSIFESPLLDSFSVESNRNAIAIARLLRKPGGSKVAPYACDARWHAWRSAAMALIFLLRSNLLAVLASAAAAAGSKLLQYYGSSTRPISLRRSDAQERRRRDGGETGRRHRGRGRCKLRQHRYESSTSMKKQRPAS